MKVIRERNEEISGTSFWRQKRGDALTSRLLQGKQSHRRQRVSTGLWEGAARLLISCPSSQVCWKCKMNTRLGTMFTIFYLENGRTPVVAQTFLQLGLRCTPWGLLPCP